MISGTECSLFAIRGLLTELAFAPVASKSAETLPFALMGSGHSNNSYCTVSPRLVPPFHVLVLSECILILAEL